MKKTTIVLLSIFIGVNLLCIWYSDNTPTFIAKYALSKLDTTALGMQHDDYFRVKWSSDDFTEFRVKERTPNGYNCTKDNWLYSANEEITFGRLFGELKSFKITRRHLVFIQNGILAKDTFHIKVVPWGNEFGRDWYAIHFTNDNFKTSEDLVSGGEIGDNVFTTKIKAIDYAKKCTTYALCVLNNNSFKKIPIVSKDTLIK